MNKRRVHILLLLFLLFSGLMAIPFNSQGNIRIPVAYILPHKIISLNHVSYMSNYPGMDYEYDFSTNIAVGLFNRAEIGIVATGNGARYANAKVNIVSELNYLPAISVGALNLFSDVKDRRFELSGENQEAVGNYDYTNPEDYIEDSYYVAFSKSFDFGGTLLAVHTGTGTGCFEADEKISEQLGGLFFGADITFMDTFVLMADMQAKHFSAGFGVTTGKFTASVALNSIDEIDSKNEPKIALNIGYVFDNLSSNSFTGRISAGDRAGTLGDIFIRKNRSDDSKLIEELKKMNERRKQIERETEETKRILEEDTDNE